MATSSHPNSSSIPYVSKVVLDPTPISFAPPCTEALVGPSNPVVPTESKKAKKPKLNEESPVFCAESKNTKKAKSNEESPSVSSTWKRPDWLPEGWEVIEHIRDGGKKDKYYIEPGTGKKFRSLVEVRRHLGLEDPSKTNERKNSSQLKWFL